MNHFEVKTFIYISICNNDIVGLPKHVAVLNAVDVKELCLEAVRHEIPLLTVWLKGTPDELSAFFEDLRSWHVLHANQIKVAVLGRWYDLPGRVVERIKDLISATKDYDHYFLNVCVNYDGREEIADACKLIAHQVRLGKLDPETITPLVVKENIYTSAFLPVDLLIAPKNSTQGFLLWDSAHAKIYITPETTRDEFLKALEWFKAN